MCPRFTSCRWTLTWVQRRPPTLAKRWRTWGTTRRRGAQPARRGAQPKCSASTPVVLSPKSCLKPLCPRFTSFCWTLTWVQRHSPTLAKRWRTWGTSRRRGAQPKCSASTPVVLSPKSCLKPLCPRFTSFCWTLTWVQRHPPTLAKRWRTWGTTRRRGAQPQRQCFHQNPMCPRFTSCRWTLTWVQRHSPTLAKRWRTWGTTRRRGAQPQRQCFHQNPMCPRFTSCRWTLTWVQRRSPTLAKRWRTWGTSRRRGAQLQDVGHTLRHGPQRYPAYLNHRRNSGRVGRLPYIKMPTR